MDQKPVQPTAPPSLSQTETVKGIVPKKKRNYKKLIIIISAVGLVLLISELGYYLFTKKGLSLFPKRAEEVSVEPERAPGRSFADIIPTPTPAQPSPLEEAEPDSINLEVLKIVLRSIETLNERGKISFVKNSTVNFTVSGIFAEGSSVEKEIGNVKYTYLIVLENEKGTKVNYWLAPGEVLNSSIRLVAADGSSKIGLEDIRAGDNVTLKETINLLDLSPDSALKLDIEVRRE